MMKLSDEQSPPLDKGSVFKPRRVTSDELLAGRNELAILHEGEEYRLRKTSKGKLILTK